jgi:hypothetical protein
MSRALLEMAPSADAGFRVNSHAGFELAVSLKSAQQSIESKRCGLMGRKNGFFRPQPAYIPENRWFSGMLQSI